MQLKVLVIGATGGKTVKQLEVLQLKWRQFEPKVILLAVGWLCQLTCVDSRPCAFCFKGETVTRTERASQGMNRNSSLTGSHQRSGFARAAEQ